MKKIYILPDQLGHVQLDGDWRKLRAYSVVSESKGIKTFPCQKWIEIDLISFDPDAVEQVPRKIKSLPI